ncbi:MAG: hypothetical protein PHX83_15780 [Acidobacteriia bacterium]|nr:hypothetical protein [Terriglobia bacterium]
MIRAISEWVKLSFRRDHQARPAGPTFSSGLVLILAIFWWGNSWAQTSTHPTGENNPAQMEQARKWIQNSITSYGGTERLTAIASLSYSNQSVGADGKTVKFQVYFKGMDKFRSEVTGENFFAMTVTNGPTAWLKSESTIVDLVAGDVQALKVSSQIQSQPYAVYDLLTKFWAKAGVSAGNTDIHLIGVSGFLDKNYTRGEITLDAKTALMRRFQYEEEVDTPQGQGIRKVDLTYEDYKTFSGIQLPTRVTAVQGGVKSVITFSDFRVNPELPDSFFEKPKP